MFELLDSLPDDPAFWRLVMIVLVPVSFWFGFRCWRRARLIGDTPTSRVRSAAQGYVELLGRARLTAGTAVRAPLTRRGCVWWSYQIEQKRRSGKRTQWVTVDSDTSQAPFLLEDDSGWCVVNPQGADVYPEDKRVWYGNSGWPTDVPALAGKSWLSGMVAEFRYTEHTIEEQEMVNVMGRFRTVGGVQAIDRDAAVAELLAQWKQDMPELNRRFDADHSGVLDQQEWEVARAAARAQVDHSALRDTPAEYAVVSRPDDDRPFLLASGDLERLARRYRWQAAGALLLFVVLCGVLTAQLGS